MSDSSLKYCIQSVSFVVGVSSRRTGCTIRRARLGDQCSLCRMPAATGNCGRTVKLCVVGLLFSQGLPNGLAAVACELRLRSLCAQLWEGGAETW